MTSPELTYRREVCPADQEAVRALVSSSGFFSTEEILIAVELVAERLSRGEGSGYSFLLAEGKGRVAGYTCFGPVPGSLHSYDLYWIAVDNGLRRKGIGKDLLFRSEELILKNGGRRIYIETSSRPQYGETLAFYRSCGYKMAAFLEDFYAPADGKIILVKAL